MHTGLVEKLEGRRNLRDLGVDGRIQLPRMLKNYDGGVVWIHLAHNADK
jgi:hypothetical protein